MRLRRIFLREHDHVRRSAPELPRLKQVIFVVTWIEDEATYGLAGLRRFLNDWTGHGLNALRKRSTVVRMDRVLRHRRRRLMRLTTPDKI